MAAAHVSPAKKTHRFGEPPPEDDGIPEAPVMNLDMDDSDKGWRDVPWFILFYVHVIVIAVLAFAIGIPEAQGNLETTGIRYRTHCTGTGKSLFNMIIHFVCCRCCRFVKQLVGRRQRWYGHRSGWASSTRSAGCSSICIRIHILWVDILFDETCKDHNPHGSHNEHCPVYCWLHRDWRSYGTMDRSCIWLWNSWYVKWERQTSFCLFIMVVSVLLAAAIMICWYFCVRRGIPFAAATLEVSCQAVLQYKCSFGFAFFSLGVVSSLFYPYGNLRWMKF